MSQHLAELAAREAHCLPCLPRPPRKDRQAPADALVLIRCFDGRGWHASGRTEECPACRPQRVAPE